MRNAMLALSLLLSSTALAQEASLTTATHQTLAPTGELVPRGKVELAVHELGLFNTVSVGVSDRVELSIAAPVVPVIGGVGVRLGLLPRDLPLKIVAGLAIYTPIVEPGESLVQPTLTAAVSTPRVNFHGTVSALIVDGDEGVGILTAGASFKVGPRMALFADVARLSSPSMMACDAVDSYGEGCGCGCESLLVVPAVQIGVKYFGSRIEVDAGLISLDADDGLALPFISLTTRL